MNTLQCMGEMMDIHNLDREAGKIFVTGASGVLGGRIAAKLVLTGYANVRLGISTTASTNSADSDSVSHSIDPVSNHPGAEVVEFDWKREETFAPALRGIKSVIIIIPYERYWYKHFSKFLQACKLAKVKHFVKLSFYLSHVPGTRHIPFAKYHLQCDEMLMKLIVPDEEYVSQMSYTIVAASHLMSHPTGQYSAELNGIRAVTKMYSATNNRAANYISPNDVAEATVRIVLSPHDHYNRVYTLLGPDLVTRPDVTQFLSKFFGKQLQHVDISRSQHRTILIDAGTPLWAVNDRMSMQRVMASGLEENIVQKMRNDFERICCHCPESFTEYLTDVDSMSPTEMGRPVANQMSV